MVYLDNAATTYPKPEAVYREMDYVNRQIAVNAGRGAYRAAKEAAMIIDDTRNRLLELTNSIGYADVILAPSVTHAFNQILPGIRLTKSSVVYITPYEHNAVARTMEALKKKIGFTIEYIPLLKNLEIDLQKTEYLFLQKEPDLIVSTALSNVTGYILPIKELFALAKRYEAITVLDAAQAMGLIPMDFQVLQVDIMGFAGHKTLYGPFGIGGVILKKGVKLEPVLTGGTGSNSLNLSMPDSIPGRYEAASQNIVAIAGLLASLKELDQEEHEAKIRKLTAYLIDGLQGIHSVKILGIPNREKVLGIVSFQVRGYTADEVGKILDNEFDVAVRTGYHCAPYIHDYLDDKAGGGTVRVGLGMFNTEQDINVLLGAVKGI